MSQDERAGCEREMAKLGYDPFAHDLGEGEKTTLETFVGHLQGEKLIPRKLGMVELI